jgi:hypothetical protein
MSEPKGEIDPRSTYAIRVQAMDMAITARHKDYDADLIQMAIEIEGFLLGDNSRLAPSPEQPKDTSNEDSTEAMVEEGSDLSGSYVKAESVSKMLPPESDPITPMADLTAPKDYDLGQSVVIETDGERTHEGFNGQAQE